VQSCRLLSDLNESKALLKDAVTSGDGLTRKAADRLLIEFYPEDSH